MKYCITLVIILASIIGYSQSSVYNPALANKLGANEYGMKKYVMAFLYEGPTKISDTAEINRIQNAHLKNIIRLAAEGKLIVAGPFLDNKELRGIFIFNVPSVEEAMALTLTDPAIKAGILKMDLHPWYGSAALVQTVELHKTLQKKGIAD